MSVSDIGIERAAAARPAGISVMILGLRGCPDVQGGVERHVEKLVPLLVAQGCNVEIVARAPYVPVNGPKVWQGARICRLYSPTNRHLEAASHTLLGVLRAGYRRPDILHIHAIGPALFVPLARLFGLKVVVTHHGYDYDRDKWGGFARGSLRLGEALGMRFAHGRIAVSSSIARKMHTRHKVSVEAIPNGVTQVSPGPVNAVLALGLEPGKYVLSVGRIVPEKRHLDLIEAFARAGLGDWKLAIVGAPDHPGEYSRSVEEAARRVPNVVMTGYRQGEALAALYSHAGLFVLPSSHEGMPIALLEALSFGVPALASAIDANQEAGLPPESHFPVGDVEALAALISRRCRSPMPDDMRERLRAFVVSTFTWSSVAGRTLAVYLNVLGV